MGNTEHVHVHSSGYGIIHKAILTIVVSKPMRGVLSRRGKGTSGKDKVTLIKSRVSLISANHIKIFRSSFGHHMSIETVNIILSLIDARICGIQRYRIVIVALIIFEIREEWQVPCTIFVLTEGLVP